MPVYHKIFALLFVFSFASDPVVSKMNQCNLDKINLIEQLLL